VRLAVLTDKLGRLFVRLALDVLHGLEVEFTPYARALGVDKAVGVAAVSIQVHQIKYFAAVAETGSFVRAAERCHMSQPSLSQQIMKLEKELGYSLFDRLNRTVLLTEAGQALLPEARRG